MKADEPLKAIIGAVYAQLYTCNGLAARTDVEGDAVKRECVAIAGVFACDFKAAKVDR